MRTVLTLVVGALVGALIAVGVMLATDDDPPAQANALSTAQLTSADCLELIPDPVLETLGWQPGDMASENAGRCERYGDDGSITVGDLAVVTSAEQVYDERCSDLFEGDATPDLDLDWLPEGTTACARLLPAGQVQGMAELFLLTDDDEVVQIRLAALSPTGQSAVQFGLAGLVETAEARF